MHTTRRGFLMSSACSGVLLPGVALAQQIGALSAARPLQDQRVVFAGDGLGLTPAEQAVILNRLVSEADFKPDTYLAGGVVERLEQIF